MSMIIMATGQKSMLYPRNKKSTREIVKRTLVVLRIPAVFKDSVMHGFACFLTSYLQYYLKLTCTAKIKW